MVPDCDSNDAPPDLGRRLAELEARFAESLAGGRLKTRAGRGVARAYLAVIRAARAGDRDAVDWLLGRGKMVRYLVGGEFVYRFVRHADAGPDPDLTEPIPARRC